MTAPITVADFIAYLQTLPQEAIVQCISVQDYPIWENIDIQSQCNVIDFRGNQFAKPENPNFNKVILEIGEK
jgi:hypothetical protein